MERHASTPVPSHKEKASSTLQLPPNGPQSPWQSRILGPAPTEQNFSNGTYQPGTSASISPVPSNMYHAVACCMVATHQARYYAVGAHGTPS